MKTYRVTLRPRYGSTYVYGEIEIITQHTSSAAAHDAAISIAYDLFWDLDSCEEITDED